MTSNVVTPGPTRINGFDSNDPADVAQYDLIKDNFLTYEPDRDARRAAVKAAMLSANFTPEDIAVADLHDA